MYSLWSQPMLKMLADWKEKKKKERDGFPRWDWNRRWQLKQKRNGNKAFYVSRLLSPLCFPPSVNVTTTMSERLSSPRGGWLMVDLYAEHKWQTVAAAVKWVLNISLKTPSMAAEDTQLARDLYAGVESILTSSVTIWCAASTAKDKGRPQRITRSAEKVIGCNLLSLQDVVSWKDCGWSRPTLDMNFVNPSPLGAGWDPSGPTPHTTWTFSFHLLLINTT